MRTCRWISRTPTRHRSDRVPGDGVSGERAGEEDGESRYARANTEHGAALCSAGGEFEAARKKA